jgi:hypothetical protein
MTWTYSGDPAASERDAVRFEIPDTDQSAELVSDEEISYALEEEGSVLGAAARCCEKVAGKFAQQADVATGDVKLTYSTQAKTLAVRAKELRALATGTHAPYSGNMSRSRKEGFAEDEDLEQGTFRRGQFDSPYAV